MLGEYLCRSAAHSLRRGEVGLVWTLRDVAPTTALACVLGRLMCRIIVIDELPIDLIARNLDAHLELPRCFHKLRCRAHH